MSFFFEILAIINKEKKNMNKIKLERTEVNLHTPIKTSHNLTETWHYKKRKVSLLNMITSMSSS